MARARRKGKRLGAREVQQICEAEIHDSIGWVGGDISEDRRKAYDYYDGDIGVNAPTGRSNVVSSDVLDTIESVLPDLVEVFLAGDEFFRCGPAERGDEEFADQATDYLNYVMLKDNRGFTLVHDWIKDALLAKNGYVKAWWDDEGEPVKETLEDVNSAHLQQILADNTIEIVAATEGEEGYDIELMRHPRGRVRIEAVPPEELLISRRTKDLFDADFVCHRTKTTASNLIADGYPRALIDTLAGSTEDDFNEEKTARFRAAEENPIGSELEVNWANRPIWIYECYLRIDMDGDGVAERRMVTLAGGGGYSLLPDPKTGDDATEVDHHPFFDITPRRTPHKHIGGSLAELAFSIQEIKTSIQRQLLDNMSLINNARNAVNERVNVDDYLTLRPGGVVRVKGEGPVGDSITPIVTQPLGATAFQQLEYWDGVRETRTGMTRLNQGLDPDSLNKTASGMNQLLGRSQGRLLFIARMFAETGFLDLGRRILKLLVQHQDKPRVLRLRNEWIEMDPRGWNADMDVTIDVGLGTGTQDQRGMALMQILNIQERMALAQGGVDGPLVNAENIANAARRLTTVLGYRNADAFFIDPDAQAAEGAQQPEEPPPPDPKLIEVQVDDQREREKIRLTHEREVWKIRLDDERKRMELGVRAEADDRKLALDAQTKMLSAPQERPEPRDGDGQSSQSAARALRGMGAVSRNGRASMGAAVAGLQSALERASSPREITYGQGGPYGGAQ